MSDIHLKIDANEPAIVAKAFKERDFEIRADILKIGDIEFGDIIIERKTINDFITSIRKDLFWRKLEEMQKNYDEAYLYLEWSNEEYVDAVIHRKNPVFVVNAIQGAYQALDDIKYVVKHFNNIGEGVHYFAEKFNRKLKEGKVGRAPNIPRKVGHTLDEMRIISLACIPKVGYRTAEKILGTKTLFELIRESEKATTKQGEIIRKFFCTRDL